MGLAQGDPHSTSLVVVRDEASGLYKFGCELDGAFVTFAVQKLGYVDGAIEVARADRDAQATATPPPVEQAAPPSGPDVTPQATAASSPAEGQTVTPPPGETPPPPATPGEQAAPPSGPNDTSPQG